MHIGSKKQKKLKNIQTEETLTMPFRHFEKQTKPNPAKKKKFLLSKYSL